MGWFKVIQALLAVINVIASYLREEKLMNAGESRAIAKSLATLQSRLGIAKAVADEVAAMTTDEIDNELKGD